MGVEHGVLKPNDRKYFDTFHLSVWKTFLSQKTPSGLSLGFRVIRGHDD